MDRLFDYMHRRLDALNSDYTRYMYDRLPWESRMFALIGPRGIGKTTLFLQHLRNERTKNKALYVTADDMYFADHTLFDTADELYKNGGLYFYIDEIHKYKNWSQELKMMYDLLPELSVYFTGSSVMDVLKGTHDLSRRAPVYEMQGLSFREWLGIRHGIELPQITLEQILENEIESIELKRPLPYFKEYLKTGYYPFSGGIEFPIVLDGIISATLEIDIPQYAGFTLATSRKLRRLMAAISVSAPFKPNMTKLASQIGASRNNVEGYLEYMNKAGMIARLKAKPTGLAEVGKTEKVYLDNTNILYNLSEATPDIGTVRETFFFNQMRVGHDVCASPISDFLTDGITFEIGGKNKGSEQIKDARRGYIVKDDIESGFGNVVPLWAFGFLY